MAALDGTQSGCSTVQSDTAFAIAVLPLMEALAAALLRQEASARVATVLTPSEWRFNSRLSVVGVTHVNRHHSPFRGDHSRRMRMTGAAGRTASGGGRRGTRAPGATHTAVASARADVVDGALERRVFGVRDANRPVNIYRP